MDEWMNDVQPGTERHQSNNQSEILIKSSKYEIKTSPNEVKGQPAVQTFWLNPSVKAQRETKFINIEIFFKIVSFLLYLLNNKVKMIILLR